MFKGLFSIWFIIFTVFLNNPNLTNEIRVKDYTKLPTDGVYDTFSHSVEFEEFYRTAYDIGNCHTLKGKQTVFLFFIDDKESSWTKKEVKQFTDKKILPALKFLEQQAKEWDIELSFEVKRFSKPLSKGLNLYCDQIVDKELGMEKYSDLMVRVASMFDAYPDDFFSDLADDYDSVIPLIILNKDGKSYAERDVGDYSYIKPEYDVIFADNFNSPKGSWRYDKEKVALIANHILFMFGADNFYNKPQGRKLAEEQCFYDIMFLNSYDTEKLKVGEVTAYNIGWIDEIPKVCYDENWFK
jgi:hypothetical protein